MSAPAGIPMPLRVPEIAPALGRLIVPRRLTPPWVPVDDIREKLATRVLDLAGEARRAAAQDNRDEALEALGRASWLAAWEQGVGGAAERVADALDREIERNGHAVRMPRRRWRARLLAGSERRAIAARFGTGGGGLVDALDQVAATSASVRNASVLDHGAHLAWQEALQTAARRLEAAWLALEEAVALERTRWAPELEAIARWRPSLWPVLVVWGVGAAALIWLGLILSGYVDAPAWLAQWLGF